MRMIIAAAVLALMGCAEQSSEGLEADGTEFSFEEGASISADYSNDSAGQGYDSNDEAVDEREPFDEYDAKRAAERQLAGEGYDYSYGCTDDCSGHEAGWSWRADNGYSTEGNSQSFAEGGYAYDEALDRKVDEMRDDYESGLESDY